MVPVQEQGVVGVLTEDGNDNVVPDLKCLPCLENSTFCALDNDSYIDLLIQSDQKLLDH